MIDQMAYNYQTGTNKLNYIADPYHPTSADIEGQSANNYTYDAIGNLTQDVKGGINDIMWNPYGKITRIDKGTNGVLLYSYDAMGNRIKKSFTQSNDNVDKIWYVRDAQGNIMAIYSRKNYGTNQQVLLENYELYGSSRLGSLNLGLAVEGDYNLTVTTNYTRSLGLKQYELSNHLGNVLTTFSDQRVFAPTGMSSTNSNALIAKLISAQDYYPFGMIMDGRSWNTDKVKFGFNGKENDNEIAGNNNSLDFGARIYNPRIGRMLSTDPFEAKFPYESPYNSFGNNPIFNLDIEGKYKYPGDKAAKYRNDYPIFTKYLASYVKNDVANSTNIKNALKSNGGFNDKQIIKSVTWGEKSDVTIKIVPGDYFYEKGATPNPEERCWTGQYNGDGIIYLNKNFIDDFEKIMKDKSSTMEEKQAVLLILYATLNHELTHHGRRINNGYGYDQDNNVESGEATVKDVYLNDSKDNDVKNNSEGNIKTTEIATKVVEEKSATPEGKKDLPTVPASR